MGAIIVGAELKNFENMESIHTSFGGFYLDIQNHIVEYPRGCINEVMF